MSEQSFTLFDTAIGACGVVWAERGVMGVQLPEADEARTRARLLRRYPGAIQIGPPAAIQVAIDAMAALLRGEPADLSFVELDLDGVDAFHRRVYEVARAIPPGSTLTYGEVAARIGDRGAARAVGQALGQNPFPIVVPCHRVLAAAGGTGGFSAPGGVESKLRMLQIEGAHREGPPSLFDALGGLGFSTRPPR